MAITGLGAVSPIGNDVDAFWRSSLESATGTRRLEFEWMEGKPFRTRVGAPVRGFDLTAHGYTVRDVRTLDLATQFALAACAMALDDAGLTRLQVGDKSAAFKVEGVDPDRVAVVVGTGMGGLGSLEAAHAYYLEHGSAVGAAWLRHGLPMCIANAASAQIAIRHGFHGESKSVSTACAAGTMAIGDACRLIWSGVADVAIAGGTEALLSDHDGLGLLGFDVLRCMSTREEEPARASLPFHAKRDGFVLGEGAGMLVLEDAAHARARGARIHAEIAAYEAVSDAYSMLQPEPDGIWIQKVMRRALESAGLSQRDVRYVNAHGTGTRQGDRIECSALQQVLGPFVADAWVGATKSLTGHAIGASGAFEAITSALAVRDGIIPPTANLDEVDPECELRHVRGEPVRERIDVALTTSYAFGGHDAALVLLAAR